MNPKIYLLKSSEAQNNASLIKKLEDENYDIVITYPDNYTQEQLNEIVNSATIKFKELTNRASLKSTAAAIPISKPVIKQIPEGERKKRKRIYR